MVQPMCLYFVFVFLMRISAAEQEECSDVLLRGAGTYTPHLVFGDASAAYSAIRYQQTQTGVDFHYTRRNSEYGIERITGRHESMSQWKEPLLFAATTSELSESDRIMHPELKTFPVMAGALVILYNIPEAKQANDSLILGTKTLVKIYEGQITHWDDEELVRFNPHIALPHKPIKVVARSDSSGSTKVFTAALGKFDLRWTLKYGLAFSSPEFVGGTCCNNTRWPANVVQFFADQWAGMVGILNSIEYTIGYEQLGNVARFGTSYARLVNKAGMVTEATSQAIQAAMDYHLFRSTSLTFSMSNALDKKAYPIAQFIYMTLNSSTAPGISCCTMQEFSGMVAYLTGEAEDEQFEKHSFVRLSKKMGKTVKNNVLKTFTCNGKHPYDMYLASTQDRFGLETYHYVIIIFFIIFTSIGIVGSVYVFKLRKTQQSGENDWFLAGKVKLIKNAQNVHRFMKEKRNSVKPAERSYLLPGMPMDSARSSQSQPRWSNTSSVQSSQTHSKSIFSIGSDASTTVETNQNLYEKGEMDGNPVMLEQIGLSFPSTWHKETRRLISKLREDIIHENVINFLGVTVIDGINYAVLQNASKGTLHYVLQSTHFELTDAIKFNMSLDIAEGLAYLHRKNIMHGLLSSLTCYVNSSWTIKVGSWERFSIFFCQNPKQFNSEIQFKFPDNQRTLIKMLYMDPEIYCARRFHFDVYSFGMILLEIFTGKIPFNKEVEFDGTNGYEDILENKFFNYSLIPEMSTESIPPSVQDLINSCCGDPNLRPTAAQICATLDRIKPTRKGIVDVMMDTIENYTELLEDKVKKRTEELKKATNRMQELLHEVLPPDTATKLLKGEEIAPEFFDCVTVYFSDITGFVNMCSRSSPMEVMTFLNDLWMLFDSVIEQHDVYKADTIGDAYMVCSGLPKRNGVQHCKNICDMALSLLAKCCTFKIRHMPAETLKIRIGINCGPVTTGVVGSKMPQYCVFGDTVNSAARMESTSVPLKIQLSDKANELLKTHFPVFETKLRGEINIKGKGKMKTYWLVPPKNHVVYKNPDYIN